MKCPDCQFDNRPGVSFCEECGTRFELLCPSCGAKIPANRKFCGECGQPLTIPSKAFPKELSFEEKIAKIQRYLPGGITEKILSQRDRIEGERKQVTVLFTDMAGYTPLTEKLDPEEAYSLMDGVYEILIRKVNEYGGTVNELTGDGIMALFGAPIAQEDAPQRAIRASLAIHREIAPSTSRIRFDVSAERGLTPFVGRKREKELILDAFERTRSGRGQAVSIVSEAGMGKSRLLYEFRKAVLEEEFAGL